MSSKSINVILSYTISKFVRFFETQCIYTIDLYNIYITHLCNSKLKHPCYQEHQHTIYTLCIKNWSLWYFQI